METPKDHHLQYCASYNDYRCSIIHGTPYVCHLLLQEGDSPLHFACSFGNIDAVKYLVGTHGMNVNERNRVSTCTLVGVVGLCVYRWADAGVRTSAGVTEGK